MTLGQALLDQSGALRFALGPEAFDAGYDANGNLVGRLLDGRGELLGWDAENRLVSLTQPDAVSTFVHDGDGNRVKTVVTGSGGTSTVAHLGGHYEWRDGAVQRTYYYHSGQRVAMRQGGVTTWLFGDHLGSTSVTYRAGDGQVVSQRYYAWGAVRPGPGNALPTDYTFTGQRLDELSGLMYYGARWYDPYLNRFIQPDTVVPNPGDPQSLNRFAYARNNPLRYTDPSGHRPREDAGPWTPYFGQWDLEWQKRWAAEHGGQYLTWTQVQVLDELNAYFGPLSDQIGRPGGISTRFASAALTWAVSGGTTKAGEMPGAPTEFGVFVPVPVFKGPEVRQGPDGITEVVPGGQGQGVAITLGNVISYADEQIAADKTTQAHEYYHVLHYRKLGAERYALMYVALMAWHGTSGPGHPMEANAYAVQGIYSANWEWLPHPSTIPWHR